MTGGNDSPVFILVFLVDAAHERGGGRQDLVDEDEDGLLRGELDPLPDHVHELADGEVGRYEVLFLIDRSDVTLLDLLTDDLDRAKMSVICCVLVVARTVGESDGLRRGSP